MRQPANGSKNCRLYALRLNYLYTTFFFRFLATGNSFRDMEFTEYRARSTISAIVRIVCQAIWRILLKECMPEITTELLEEIAEDFDRKTYFPNCMGALHGKHIRICSPAHSGSLFFNYKSCNSIVLMALTDSKYRFIYVDIGAYGKAYDSTVFNNSKIHELILRNTRNTIASSTKPLPGFVELVPYVFIADEGLPLTNFMLRPYPAKNITVEQDNFNTRLSRARKYVECSFGILGQCSFGIRQ